MESLYRMCINVIIIHDISLDELPVSIRKEIEKKQDEIRENNMKLCYSAMEDYWY